jgi:apolipoprotein N-acyltransferase
MNRAAVSQYRRAGIEPPPARAAFASRWYGRLALSFGPMLLLTAAYPPLNQFYFAWIGLVPWLLVLQTCRSQKAAFFWSFLPGLFFFSANLWWLYGVTSVGTPVLMGILALYWGFTGMILRGAGLMRPVEPVADDRSAMSFLTWPTVRIGLIAVVFVTGAEWVRGTWPWHGLPWLFLGHTQVPFGWVCQIADLGGVTVLSMLIVAVNAWVAMWVGNRLNTAGIARAGLVLAALFVASVGYGVYRCRTEPAMWETGPKVLAVQPNFPQSNDGSKGATHQQLIDFHLSQTEAALAKNPGVDLAAWSETVMPMMSTPTLRLLVRGDLSSLLDGPVNPVPARTIRWDDSHGGTSAAKLRVAIRDLAIDLNTAVVTGGEQAKYVPAEDGYFKLSERGNVAYFFDRRGALDEISQVKIHLVPFGEYLPFREYPLIFNQLLRFVPKDMASYELTPGTEESIHDFTLNRPAGQAGMPWKFTTPICFEDVDGALCATMVRPKPETPAVKSADFLVNLTNDGWFAGPQNRQHFQIATFRAIENRVPLVRSVNTGISGFIDPLGRGYNQLPARTEGVTVGVLPIDRRVTVYTRTGPILAQACAVITLILAGASLGVWFARKLVRRQLPISRAAP